MSTAGPAASIAVLAHLLFAPDTAACEGAAAPTPTVTVAVTAQTEPAIVAASEAELRALAAETGRSTPEGAVTRGLTTGQTEARASYTLTATTMADGTRCMALQSIAGEVVERSAVIRIDESYRPGTCQYDAVLVHEREHIRINAEALDETAALLEERLGRVAGRWAGRWLADAPVHPIEEEVEAAIGEAVRLARENAERRHRSIDSPAGYAEVQARCETW